MLASNIPLKLPIPFANNAGGSFIRTIPTDSQIGIQDGAASLHDGFVPDNFLPEASGGVPPFGQDMNGILYWISQITQWAQAGGAWPFDPTFSSEIGGYPARAIIQSAVVPGKLWMSQVDNNTTDPDSASATNWCTPPGLFPSGTPVASFSSVVPPGFVAANALTIGDGASGANTASGTMLLLFAAIWNEFPNSQCPILNSDGSPGTRGANPFLDFAAHKRMTLPNAKGCALVGVDTMGGASSSFLSGVPIITGNATTPGSQFGENLHTLARAETPTGITSSGVNSISVTSTVSDINRGFTTFNVGTNGATSWPATQSAVTSTGNNTINVTSNNTGGGAHNNVSQAFGVYWNLAL